MILLSETVPKTENTTNRLMPLSTSSHRKNPSNRSKRNPSALEAILQGRNDFESILKQI